MSPRRDPVAPGQESVWDYPRPPALDPVASEVVVEFAGEVVARTTRSIRVLETSHPPGYYIPAADVRADLLVPAPGASVCEWKGTAVYHTVVGGGRRAVRAAWSYPDPLPGFEPIAGHLSFYPGRVDRCTVDGEEVVAQAGDFYGGWITSKVVGPFKGGPGTWGW